MGRRFVGCRDNDFIRVIGAQDGFNRILVICIRQ